MVDPTCPDRLVSYQVSSYKSKDACAVYRRLDSSLYTATCVTILGPVERCQHSRTRASNQLARCRVHESLTCVKKRVRRVCVVANGQRSQSLAAYNLPFAEPDRHDETRAQPLDIFLNVLILLSLAPLFLAHWRPHFSSPPSFLGGFLLYSTLCVLICRSSSLLQQPGTRCISPLQVCCNLPRP